MPKVKVKAMKATKATKVMKASGKGRQGSQGTLMKAMKTSKASKAPSEAVGGSLGHGDGLAPGGGQRQAPPRHDVNVPMQHYEITANGIVNHEQLVEIELDVKDLETISFVMTLGDLKAADKDKNFTFKSVHAEKNQGRHIMRLERINFISGTLNKQHHYLQFAHKFSRLPSAQ